NPRNAERIFPFLGGDELNSDPTHAPRRHVISFASMSLEEAQAWPDLLKIIETKVRPQRAKLGDNADARKRKTYWWRWGQYAYSLFEAIQGMDRLLVIARVSDTFAFTFVPASVILSEKVVVIARDNYSHFSVLQSRVHEDWAFTVVFHPSGNLVATGGGDDLIKLWSWPELVEVGRFRGHTNDVHAIAFTPDGQRLVSAGDDQVVRIWDVATRQELHCLTGHTGTIPGLAISPDGHTIASASRDDTVRLWSMEGEFLAELAGHAGDVMSVAFHPTGRELATASYDQTLRLWSLPAEGTPQEIGRLSGHTDWAFSIAYSADGGELLSTGGDGAILFDRQSGRQLWHTREAANLSHGVWLGAEGFALASADGSVRLGEASSDNFAHTLWTRFSPDFTARVSLTAE
ncbi:MAG: WD40 repeat domain-containing protein, partial [Pirellulaceae bacterium]|nr:WD40 repeat domain-containing protein [Pirellulaceae bacterium]